MLMIYSKYNLKTGTKTTKKMPNGPPVDLWGVHAWGVILSGVACSFLSIGVMDGELFKNKYTNQQSKI